jgi:hypothetical protein
MTLLCGVFLTVHNKPLAVFNSNGVWVARFGLIPWDNITEVSPYLNVPPTIEAVEIRVKNYSLLYKHANASAKISIFFAKKFSYPPIIIANMTVDRQEIIMFANQFLK